MLSALGLAIGLGMMIFAEQKTQAAGPPVGPWYVNSTTGNNSNDCLSAVTACQTINAAIGKAVASGTINVAAGTYPEVVAVTKTVNLLGAQAGVDARTRSVPVSSESVVGTGDGAFQILADNVKIDGFTIQGVTNDPSQSPFTGLGAGIWSNPGFSGTHGGHQILNNIIQNNISGIELDNDGTIQTKVQFNLIRNNNSPGAGSGNGIGVNFGLHNAMIDQNQFSGHTNTSVLVNAPPSDGIAVSNNQLIRGSSERIVFGGVDNSSITGNTSLGSTAVNGTIRLFGGNSNITISCNLLIGGRIGIRVDNPFAIGSNNAIAANNNNLQGNVTAGFQVDAGGSGGPLNAQNNWWGNPTGPTIASNPSGTGVKLINPDFNVFYTPFSSSQNGCAPAPPTDSIGLFDGVNSRFFLRNSNTTGVADITYYYGPAASGWTPIMGDWDGDGKVTAGFYDGANGRFFLRNSNTNGFADIVFSYGPSGAGWLPIVGDWDGDGTDTVGLYAPNLGRFFLRNSNTTGFADIDFFYGPAGAGWLPLAGDWNGDGITTIGLFDGVNSRFFLRNTNNAGVADITFYYGPGGAGWIPITGDWDGDGATTVGLFAPGSSIFFLRNSNSNGFADITFQLGSGNSGWKPLAGNWDGQ
jgi:hypothetical protein